MDDARTRMHCNDEMKRCGIPVCQYTYWDDKDHGAQDSDLYGNAI